MTREIKGLVIRTTDIKESDRLITIFSEEMGVVSALAQGARSLKSRKMSSTMQFCYSRFILNERGDKYYVKEAELIESFFELRSSIESLALSSYIADVLSDVTVATAEKELLRLALNSLYAIANKKYPLNKIKAVFEMRAASIIGFMPDVLHCRECGEGCGNFYFDIMGGTIKCYNCNEKDAKMRIEPESAHEAHIVRLLTEGAKIALGYAIHAPIEKIFSFNISDEDMQLFSSAAETYLINQLERGFKTLDFYKEVTE